MVDDKNKNSRSLIRKHKPMTRDEVSKSFKQMREMKKEMTTDAAALEQNLLNFNKITDPLVNPENGKVLCWIRRPTVDELEKLIPTELLEYRNRPEDVPVKLMQKHQDFEFEMMAELIENPKKTGKWWKSHANFVFQRLFQLHLRGVMEDLGVSAENF